MTYKKIKQDGTENPILPEMTQKGTFLEVCLSLSKLLFLVGSLVGPWLAHQLLPWWAESPGTKLYKCQGHADGAKYGKDSCVLFLADVAFRGPSSKGTAGLFRTALKRAVWLCGGVNPTG